jgi:hypothetical protein
MCGITVAQRPHYDDARNRLIFGTGCDIDADDQWLLKRTATKSKLPSEDNQP